VLLLKKVWALQIRVSKAKNIEICDKPSSSSLANVVEEKSEDSKLVLTVTVSDGCFNDKWVLDTACTFHLP